MSKKIELSKSNILQKTRQKQVLLQETENHLRAISKAIGSGTAGKNERCSQIRNGEFE